MVEKKQSARLGVHVDVGKHAGTSPIPAVSLRPSGAPALLGKYRVLVIAIAFFLIFDLGVLVLNFVISSQIAADALSVNLAGRQRMLSQRTAKLLLQLERAQADGAAGAVEVQELRGAFKLFDATLDAFRDGGAAIGGTGEGVRLNRVDSAEGRAILERAYAVWTPYREKLLGVIAADAPARAQVQAAVAVALSANVQLLGLMNELTTHVEKVAASKANFLRVVQVTGITLATLNFLLILFHFLRHLRAGDRAVEAARRETDEILHTVSDGLFLLDRQLRIGTQHSAALAGIFQRADLGGAAFLQLMRGLVDEQTLTTTKDYVELLFGDRVNEKLVQDLNPLDCVEVTLRDAHGGFVRKFLEFRFARVFEDEQLAHLLVTVNDVTAQVKLQRDLRSAQENAQNQLDLLLEVLHLDPALVAQTLTTTRDALDAINGVLQAPVHPSAGYRAKVDVIFRLAHRIKGDAAAVGLGTLERAAHEIEDVLADLRAQPQISGNDFLPVTVRIEQVFARIDALSALIAQVADLRRVTGADSLRAVPAEASAANPLWPALDALCARVAERQGKRIALRYQGLPARAIPEALRKPLDAIVTQLVRNACVHGIELPAERIVCGKSELGEIAVTLLRLPDGGHELSVRDDGAGIDIEKLRAQAVAQGRATPEAAARWDTLRLVKLLFEPAFSLAATVDEDAGRGVGLDLVRASVEQLRGRIGIASTPGLFCELRIALPAAAQLTAHAETVANAEALAA